jgi:TolB-like protein/AraC-like DNA-binding protein
MTGGVNNNNEFIASLRTIIEENISNEIFGVSELSERVGMSRSNLLRKIRKYTNMSASQFIRTIRLENAMEAIKEGNSTVSEVAFMVGFSSTSYFIKCFRDQYGYPPGEVNKINLNSEQEAGPEKNQDPVKNRIFLMLSLIMVIALILIVVVKPFTGSRERPDNSIAVLPFKNDSNDSSNVYFINGLMESVLNHLQSIEDLRVVSRTSVEKYRYAPMIIPEIARELNVNYFVEGSGQKIGNEILLNIQMVEASSDRQIWSEQYRRELKDVFELQAEIAKSIAGKIEAIITPEEEKRISRVPTENMLAYDYFLKGLHFLNNPGQQNLEEALVYFDKAIAEDNEFARAYAAVAIAYYLMDKDMAVKTHTDLINTYADKALLYDNQLAQSLIAKGLFYMSNEEYKLAVSYFEKALEYNPNSDLVYVFLVDLYANYYPNTEKYLEYALKGLRINMASYDSITRSYSYLHISNAFIQSGFVDEAEKYINKSLEFFPGNIYSAYVKPYILYSRTRDLEETKQMLLNVLEMDTTRLDVIQEIAKICYYQRDYEDAYRYYSRFMAIREYLGLDIYHAEDGKIALVYSMVGETKKSDMLLEKFREFSENDNSIYKHLSLCAYYSYKGEVNKALDQLRLFSKEDNYHYWIILFIEIDPLLDNIRDTEGYKKALKTIKVKFEKYHERIRATLEKEKLI